MPIGFVFIKEIGGDVQISFFVVFAIDSGVSPHEAIGRVDRLP